MSGRISFDSIVGETRAEMRMLVDDESDEMV